VSKVESGKYSKKEKKRKKEKERTKKEILFNFNNIFDIYI